MAVALSSLQRALDALNSAEASRNAGGSSALGSASSSSPSQESLSSLKRIKHALIGNSTRKVELASRPDDLQRITHFLGYAQEENHPRQQLAHQAFLQSADILAALAIPRQECLTALINAQAHRILLNAVKSLSEAIERSELDVTVTESLFQALLHAIRALKSIYVAVVSYIDPYGARAAMQELVLASAHARTKALGLSIPSPSSRTSIRSPPLLQAKSGGSHIKQSAAENISRCAERMFLTDDADVFLHTLRVLCRSIDPVHDGSAASQQHQQALLHLCDLLATCVRTASQRDAIEASQLRLGKSQGSPETYDPFVLLSAALEEAPIQLAEAIIRAMTALLKDQTPSKGVRLPSHYVTRDGQDQNARMAERMADQSRSMRLAAADWHVAVYKSFKAVNVQWDFGIAPVIAVLLNLLVDPTPATSARAGFVLAFLVTGNQQFQEIASNMEALPQIRALLERLAQPVEPYETAQAAADRSSQEQAALLAISALSMDIEELRRKVVDYKLLPYVVSSLSSPFPNVRCAAAQCARSLSRSINIIKTALLDTNAASAFVQLLDPSEDRLTQLAILAVVCNVFIEFSPLKTTLLEMDGLVERIVDLTKVIKPRGMASSSNRGLSVQGIQEEEQDSERMLEVKALLRHHALTAIKNMTYWSSSALKQKTANCLTWEYAVALLRDPDMAVRTEMLNILRNIACNEASDIDLVVRGIGEARLFSLIEESLHTTRQEMLLHGLYLVSNIATGTEAHRSAIMNRLGIIRAVLDQLSNPSSDVRVAAVWATINLCHRPEPGHRRFNDHAQRLRSLGFESRLKEMREDPSLDVRERVRDALEGGFDPDPASHGMIMD